ncbi:MAG TPA: malto-oligosyltrehalose trehalohydrolase [Longimicrobiales bacterium]|nr:malto-oligosyltrehalose trehalohydrolase [Longimicrobiales bacterium]
MSPRPSLGPALGAHLDAAGACTFRVWAPFADAAQLLLDGPQPAAMEAEGGGYFALRRADVGAGQRYRLRLRAAGASPLERPDPCSRSQPEGVHGPSAVVPHAFDWRAGEWRGLPLRDYVLYELHVGTFSAPGTFEGAIDHLDALAALGVTAIEIMPVAQFPGERNWGYDGVYPYAAQHSYGGADGLKRLVDACHQRGLAVALDVVYNHLGPEGNYLRDFGPYFTERYHTPWGAALNFDGADSDEVRAFFIQNALQWVDEFRIDALRLDAVHAILDTSPYPFLEELADAVRRVAREQGRDVHLIAESDANDPRLLRRPEEGGYGLDGVWVDDVHHALHARLTGETRGYYADYGELGHVARALSAGFVYAGERSAFRARRRGRSPAGLAPHRFVVCVQNHDQIGNRMRGDRLTATLTDAELRVAAAALLLSPFTPLLFMGEEYGETAPFPYFVSHGDPALVDAVRDGRSQEFAAFRWEGDPPDPQAAATFERARLNHHLKERPRHAARLALYRALLELRATMETGRGEEGEARELSGAPALALRRCLAGRDATVLLAFGAGQVRLEPGGGRWRRLLETEETRFGGPGAGLPEALEGAGHLDLPGPVAAVWLRDDGEEEEG